MPEVSAAQYSAVPYDSTDDTTSTAWLAKGQHASTPGRRYRASLFHGRARLVGSSVCQSHQSAYLPRSTAVLYYTTYSHVLEHQYSVTRPRLWPGRHRSGTDRGLPRPGDGNG